jgi:hypothetical protein
VKETDYQQRNDRGYNDCNYRSPDPLGYALLLSSIGEWYDNGIAIEGHCSACQGSRNARRLHTALYWHAQRGNHTIPVNH